MELLLSKELMRYAKELELEYYEDFLPPEERGDARQTQTFQITKLIILCRERLLPNDERIPDSFIEQHTHIVERWLDDHYSLTQLENIPGLIRRTLQLTALTAKATPSAQTNFYISEASRGLYPRIPVGICRDVQSRVGTSTQGTAWPSRRRGVLRTA